MSLNIGPHDGESVVKRNILILLEPKSNVDISIDLKILNSDTSYYDRGILFLRDVWEKYEEAPFIIGQVYCDSFKGKVRYIYKFLKEILFDASSATVYFGFNHWGCKFMAEKLIEALRPNCSGIEWKILPDLQSAL